MTPKLSTILIVSLAFIAPSANAAAIRDTFMFTGTRGSTVGTFTGIVEFSGFGTDIAATGAYIISAPADFIAAGIDPTINFISGTAYNNNFTVLQSGVIVSANLFVDDPRYMQPNYNAGFELALNNSSGSVYSFQLGSNYNGNNVTYTPIIDAVGVPEPTSLALMGLGVFVSMCRLAQRKTNN